MWEGFAILSAARPVGMEVSGIPIGEMVAYWRDVRGVERFEALQDRITLTCLLDAEFMAAHRKAAEMRAK